MSMKNSNDIIGNWTRDLQTCSVVTQLTAPPRAPYKNVLNLKSVFKILAPELFFLILAHPVYKMWKIQEPNKLELWNKLHFEEEKMESIYHV